MEWQPIKTAPRDGTPILLSYSRMKFAKNIWGCIRIGRWDDGKWRLDGPGHFRIDCTHWMPLPEPPER